MLHSVDQGQGLRIATSFVSAYYPLLVSNPVGLASYYGKDSHFSFVEGPQDPSTHTGIYTGPEEIVRKIASLNFDGAKIQLESITWQPSVSGSVMIVTQGSVALVGGHRPFTQTFVLAKSAHKEKSFYVSNDCFRFLSPAQPAPVAVAVAAAAPLVSHVADTHSVDHLARLATHHVARHEEPAYASSWAEPEPEVPAPVRAPTTAWGTPAVKPKVETVRAAPAPADFVAAHYQQPAPAPVVAASTPTPTHTPAAAPAVEHGWGDSAGWGAAAAAVAEVDTSAVAAQGGSIWGKSFADVIRQGKAAEQQRSQATVVTSPAPAQPIRRGAGAGAGAGGNPGGRGSGAPQQQRGRGGGGNAGSFAAQSDKPSVFIGGLPADATDQELNDALSAFCTVAQIRRKGGYAFVDLADVASQQKALDASIRGEIIIRGQSLRVEVQTGKKPKPASPTSGKGAAGAQKKN